MRKILSCAGVSVATALMLVGLAAGPAHADVCEGLDEGAPVNHIFDQHDGTAIVWLFECYDGKAVFVGGGRIQLAS